MNERRRKLVPATPMFMHDGMPHTGDVIHFKCVDGIPADATFIGLTYDHMRDTYYFCYQSAEWDEVPDGMMLPVFYPTFTKLEVAPFLERAEKLIDAYSDYPDAAENGAAWLAEYRAFKEQTGYPE